MNENTTRSKMATATNKQRFRAQNVLLGLVYALQLVNVCHADVSHGAGDPYIEVPLDPARNPPGPPKPPRFGICSSETRAVNVTPLARAGYRLTELRAYEGARTGCLELLAQTLAAQDGSGRTATVKSDGGQGGLHGLSPAGAARVPDGWAPHAARVFASGGRTPAGCVTRIELDVRPAAAAAAATGSGSSSSGGGGGGSSAGEGESATLVLSARAFGPTPARPVTEWGPLPHGQRIAAFHLRVLRSLCGSTSGFPLVQLLPSVVAPAPPRPVASAGIDDDDGDEGALDGEDTDAGPALAPLPPGGSVAAADNGDGGDGEDGSGGLLRYPLSAPFPANRPFAACGAREAASSPAAALASGARLVALEARASPVTGCLEMLAQSYRLPGGRRRVELRAGSAGPLLEARLAPAGAVTLPDGAAVERVVLHSGSPARCVTGITLRLAGGTGSGGGGGTAAATTLALGRQVPGPGAASAAAAVGPAIARGFGGFAVTAAAEYCGGGAAGSYPILSLRPIYVAGRGGGGGSSGVGGVGSGEADGSEGAADLAAVQQLSWPGGGARCAEYKGMAVVDVMAAAVAGSPAPAASLAPASTAADCCRACAARGAACRFFLFDAAARQCAHLRPTDEGGGAGLRTVRRVGAVSGEVLARPGQQQEEEDSTAEGLEAKAAVAAAD